MAATIQFKRGVLSGLPVGSAGEPLFTTDVVRLYVGNSLLGVLYKHDATVAPTVNDDSGDGYSVGSIWTDTSAPATYICADATVGAAVWQRVTDANDLGALAYKSNVDLTTGSTDYVGTLPVNHGGTGSTSASAARTALGLEIGTNVQAFDADLSALAALTGTNTIYYRSAASTWTAVTIGSNLTFSGGTLNGNAGSVTSVALTVPSFLSVAGSPVTTSGTLAVTLANQTANTGFWGPTSGGAAAPTFRAQVVADLPALSGLTSEDVTLADSLAGYDASGAANKRFLVERALGLLALIPPRARLSTSSSDPFGTGTNTSVYYHAGGAGMIPLWDGTRWVLTPLGTPSVAIGTVTAGTVYDVFAYISSGAVAVEKLAWTNATTRATAIDMTTELPTKSGDKTRLLVGTFRASSTTTVVDDSTESGLWNMYNRCKRTLSVIDTSNSWNYTTATWRQARATATNQLVVVRGMDLDGVVAFVHANASTTAAAQTVAVGVGVDVTNANSAQIFGTIITQNGSQCNARYNGRPGIGTRTFAWLEISTATGTTTWYGDNGGTMIQSGMELETWA